MTDTQKKEIALTFIRSLQQRDPILLKTVLTDNAVWSLPGTNQISGEAAGADAIVARGQFLGEHGVNFELLHVIYGYEGMGIMLHNTGKCKGRVLDEFLSSIFKLQGDKICRIDTYITDVPMLNAYVT
jgi:ketosteroid isomerase-like protein